MIRIELLKERRKMNNTSWSLNEEQAQKIISTKPISLKVSNVEFDISLPEAERIQRAKKILEKRKKSQNA